MKRMHTLDLKNFGEYNHANRTFYLDKELDDGFYIAHIFDNASNAVFSAFINIQPKRYNSEYDVFYSSAFAIDDQVLYLVFTTDDRKRIDITGNDDLLIESAIIELHKVF